MKMNKKGKAMEISELVEKGEVIIWAIISVLAVWFLIKLFFR